MEQNWPLYTSESEDLSSMAKVIESSVVARAQQDSSNVSMSKC